MRGNLWAVFLTTQQHIMMTDITHKDSMIDDMISKEPAYQAIGAVGP